MEAKVMSGGAARNLRVADRCYRYLESNGEASVSELKDYLNTFPRGATSEQLANVLRCSPLFKVSSTTVICYGAGGSEAEVNVYTTVPLKEVIDKLRGKEHLVRKRWPKVLKDAMKKEGII
jgi:hypothetical protein